MRRRKNLDKGLVLGYTELCGHPFGTMAGGSRTGFHGRRLALFVWGFGGHAI
jgi:hypothetical protein